MNNILNALVGRASSGPRTEKLDERTAALLRASHEVRSYQESGWHCATGFDADGKITVMVHANSSQELAVAMGTYKPTHDDWGHALEVDNRSLTDKEGRRRVTKPKRLAAKPAA